MEPQANKPPYTVGLLAWLIPGAGHWYLGMKLRGAIIFAAVTLLFWSGIAIGGIRTTVDPRENAHWFLGQVCAGSNALAVVGINKALDWDPDNSAGKSWGVSHTIGVVYAGVAGLLNLLALFDAIVRSISGQVREPAPGKSDEREAPRGG